MRASPRNNGFQLLIDCIWVGILIAHAGCGRERTDTEPMALREVKVWPLQVQENFISGVAVETGEWLVLSNRRLALANETSDSLMTLPLPFEGLAGVGRKNGAVQVLLTDPPSILTFDRDGSIVDELAIPLRGNVRGAVKMTCGWLLEVSYADGLGLVAVNGSGKTVWERRDLITRFDEASQHRLWLSGNDRQAIVASSMAPHRIWVVRCGDGIREIPLRLPRSVRTWQSGAYVGLRSVLIDEVMIGVFADVLSDKRLILKIDARNGNVLRSRELTGAMGFAGFDDTHSRILAVRNIDGEELVLYSSR